MNKKSIYAFVLALLFLVNAVFPLGATKVMAETSNIINLNFIPSDSVIDPNRPVVYVVSSSSKSVYAINYETREVKKLDFNLQPERIAFANNKVYVTLLKMQHQYYTNEPLSGAVGIIDTDTLSISDQFDIDTDPYDIEADKDGKIYISPGSNQWEDLEVYSAQTKAKIGVAGQTYMSSLIQLNPVNSKLYLITTSVSPRDISTYGYSGNTFKYLYDSPYHGDYPMDPNMRISPDGRFIFNGAGTIFNSTNLQSSDITYVGKLNNPFTDAAFSSSKIYAGLSNGNISVYDYDNFGNTGIISTTGKVINLYYKDDSLISLSKLPNNLFGIEVISLNNSQNQSDGKPSEFKITNSFPEKDGNNASVSGYIVLEFNDIVNFNSSDDILDECSIKNYVYNKITFDNKLILYYDNLAFNTKYTLKLNPTLIKNNKGEVLTGDYSMDFTTGQEFSRLSGLSRYETSVEISRSGGSHSDYVVLATGEDYPDALCAAPLAAKYGAPILLTTKSTLPAVVENEIDRLKPIEIFLVGGTGVISDNIKTKLQNKGIKVTRISGVNRYETSLEVAKYIDGDSGEAFIVTGENYPDALSIASYAASKQIPILLTERTKLPDKIKAFINNKQITDTYIIGGTGVISNDVLYSLPNPERIAGSNRYETNFEVLARFEFVFSETYLATGADFADALSGAALAGTFNNPIILVNSSMPEDVVESLRLNREMMKMKRIIGGTGAVSEYIINKIFK